MQENILLALKRAVCSQGQTGTSCFLQDLKVGQPSGAQAAWVSKSLFLERQTHLHTRNRILEV